MKPPFPVSRVLEFKLFKGGRKMKPSTENQIAGNAHEVKGKIKEKVGQLTNDPELESEGIGEKIAGKIQKKIGQVEKSPRKTVKSMLVA
jgi:uncharacterized protein YjbJ (UPF0337 family)